MKDIPDYKTKINKFDSSLTGERKGKIKTLMDEDHPLDIWDLDNLILGWLLTDDEIYKSKENVVIPKLMNKLK